MFSRRKREGLILSFTDTLFQEIAKEPFQEISGHFTGDILRDWVKQNSIGYPVYKCALVLNTKKRLVSAFLLNKDNEFIYEESGKKLAVTFGAKKVDEEIRQIFQDGKVALLQIR